MTRYEKRKERFVRNIRRTLKNKLCASALFLIGIITAWVSYDATFLVFAIMFGTPLFLCRRNLIY